MRQMIKNKNRNVSESRAYLKANWHDFKNVESDQSRGTPMPDPQKKVPEDTTFIDLPPESSFAHGKIGAMEVRQAIAERRSRRRYSNESISMTELSYLLWATQGVRKTTPGSSYRTVPSAGARHSFETYVYLDRIDNIERGLYRYLPFEHKLCLLSGDAELADHIDEGLFSQRWNSAATFIWTAIPYRMEWRYSVVAHKLIALDAGHVCQNLYIACESIGCGMCAIGAYNQEKIDSVIGVDGTDEFTVYAAPVGKI